MYVVTVVFEIRPEAAAAFLPLMLENARRSLEEEPGCLHFDVCADEAVPDGPPSHIFLYEIYRDRSAFDAHLASAHFLSFDEASRPMVVRKEVSCWELLGPEAAPAAQPEQP